jgi:hypothetical protein
LKNKKEHKLEKPKTKIKDIIKKKKCKKRCKHEKNRKNFFFKCKKVEKIDKKGRKRKNSLEKLPSFVAFFSKSCFSK